MATAVIVLTGALAIPAAVKRHLAYGSLFYQQFTAIEGPGLAIIGAFALITIALLWRANREPVAAADDWLSSLTTRRRLVLGVLIAWIAIVVVVGFRLAFSHYFLADDEYSAWFQAIIYAHGQSSAVVPARWCQWIGPMTPTSINIVNGCTWHLSFEPIHSMVRAVFLAAHADWLAGPVAAVLTMLLVYSIARKLWPARPERALLAAAFIAASTQVLFMSMTMFSMYMHLLASLVWLRLYIEDRRWSIALLPVISFIALGVHSPIPHGLWVAPFLLRFLWQRRWGAVAYLACTYFIVLAFWAHQLGMWGGGTGGSAIGNPAGATGVVAAAANGTLAAVRAPFSLPTTTQQLTTSMHVALFTTWETPIAMICVLLAVLRWRTLDTVCRDLALSIIVIIVARAFGNSPQGEGWGYRIAHDAMSNVALLAAVGVEGLIMALGRRRALGLVAASFAATVLVQVPMRMVQVEQIVGPYARTSHWLEQLPARVVVAPLDEILWGRQMLRNDPFLRHGPVLMDADAMSPATLDAVRAAFPNQVRVVTIDELLAFGAPKAPLRFGSMIIGQ